MKSDGDLRMLGVRDGFAHTMIRVRNIIGQIDGLYSQRIDARHVRKRAARDAVLRPLKELDTWLTEQHASVVVAYERSRMVL